MTEEGAAYPNHRARLEATLALAMLPVGVALGLVCALASMLLLLAVVPTLIFGLVGEVPLWIALWCFLGGTVLAWATVAAIEVVSAFDWRPLPRILLAVALVGAASPLWWGPALP